MARGEATLDNTLAGFLGRIDPTLRTRATSPAPAALGRRLQQADNYLVQAGKHGCTQSEEPLSYACYQPMAYSTYEGRTA